MAHHDDRSGAAGDGVLRAGRQRRRLVIIQLVLAALAVLAVLIVVAVGLLGLGDFARRPLGG